MTDIADQFQNWLKNRSEIWGAPVLDTPEDEHRDDFVLPYVKNSEPDRVISSCRPQGRRLSAGNENKSRISGGITANRASSM